MRTLLSLHTSSMTALRWPSTGTAEVPKTSPCSEKSSGVCTLRFKCLRSGGWTPGRRTGLVIVSRVATRLRNYLGHVRRKTDIKNEGQPLKSGVTVLNNTWYLEVPVNPCLIYNLSEDAPKYRGRRSFRRTPRRRPQSCTRQTSSV